MKEDLAAIQAEFATALRSAGSEKDLTDLKARVLGRKGSLTAVLKELGSLPPEDRQTYGKRVNELKVHMEEALEAALRALAERELEARLEAEWVDISLDAGRREVGNLHPTTQIQHEIEDIFTSMGFDILDGPHVETDEYNFEALNIPKDHPARDMQDTFYLEDGNLLRTHTSPIQVRGMKRLGPPLKIIGPGKVFRSERTDASHEFAFHQLEGMMVDRDIKVAHLIYFMKLFLSKVFGREEEVRLRPGYFPFVEPGFELDIRCLLCRGKGCPVCKQVGWLELVPCGMVHPNVLRAGGIDPEAYSGFAFGLGLDRLVMMRYGIEDIRHLHGADLRFLRQFR
ncbi:MAG TPA: phenylalanine--tRNA ligase subunit alpha [Planctomycetota bacterium]|nr:phenylalanine--tRNA ligase subunit alpha [Planctomycetota bacterium]